MAAPGPDRGAAATDDLWTAAPCMLVTLDSDHRVVAANDSYLHGTGFRRGEVLGRAFWDELLAVGSRVFFQTQLAPVLALERRLEEVMLDLRTADGGRLPVLMNAAGTREAEGCPRLTMLALMGVPDRRAFEKGLRQARADAEQARAADAYARLRLELLARTNAALASSADAAVVVQRLAEVLTTRLADWCLIQRTGPEEGTEPEWSAAHTDPVRQPDVRSLPTLVAARSPAVAGLRALLDQDRAAVTAHAAGDPPDPAGTLWSPRDAASVMVVPVAVHGARTATIVLGRADQREPFGADDLADAGDIAARTGIVLDNLRRHAREHSNSVALQHALLTTPPALSRFEIATRYQPATDGNDVGGDWYDALLQPGAGLILAIGDVIGHDIHAAAAMGQLRGIVRTIAYTTGDTPAGILRCADDTAHGLGVPTLATALVARVDTDDRGAVTLQWSNAGHLPPLLMTATGVHVLDAPADPLLGLRPGLHAPRRDHVRRLDPGDVLLLYTDGLVERTDELIDTSIAALAARLGRTAALPPEQLCDDLLEFRQANTRDDVALIVFRLPADPRTDPAPGAHR